MVNHTYMYTYTMCAILITVDSAVTRANTFYVEAMVHGPTFMKLVNATIGVDLQGESEPGNHKDSFAVAV